MKLGKQGICKPKNHTFEHSVTTIPQKLHSKNLPQLPKKVIIKTYGIQIYIRIGFNSWKISSQHQHMWPFLRS